MCVNICLVIFRKNLQNCLNCSLHTGIYPDDWSHGYVHLIPKQGLILLTGGLSRKLIFLENGLKGWFIVNCYYISQNLES